MSVSLQEVLESAGYEEAHKDYEFRKAEIITKLVSIRDSEISNDVMKVWINQTIEFINERQI